MGLADNRRHMMFAVRFELDVPQDNHFVIAVDLFESAAQKLDWIVFVSAAPVFPGSRDSAGGCCEAFTLGILSNPQQKRFDGIFGIFP
jgi:hypothetical protein